MDNPVTRLLATPTTIDLPSILQESPFTFEKWEDLGKMLKQAAKAANRCNLYVAYLIGKAVNPDMLMRYFGKTVKDLADMLGCSRASLYNYKTLTEVATEHEVKTLANLGVPLKAVLLLRDIKDTLGKEAMLTAKDYLMTGDVKSLKTFEEKYREMLKESLADYHMIPGAEASESAEVEVLEEVEEEEEKLPEDNILDTDIVDEADDDDEDDDYEDDTASSHEKDAKKAYKLVSSTIGSLVKNYIDIIDNAEEQTMSALKELDVVINTTTESDFNRLISELAENNQQALEVCIKMHEVFKRYGYIKRKVTVPENVSIEQLFSSEG